MGPILLLSLLFLMLFGCEQNDQVPEVTSSSGSSTIATMPGSAVTFEAANWRSYVGDIGNQANPNNYRHTLVTGISSTTSPVPTKGTGFGGLPSRTESYTLGMAASSITDTASYCYWAYSFFPPATLRIGQSLTLRAKVRLDKIQAKDILLVLQGDRSNQPVVLFASTKGITPVKGTANFTDYSVTLPYSASVDYLVVYLVMLSNTTGSATFTDVSV